MSSAATLEYALRRQSEVALRHYLTQVHALGAELSLSDGLVDVTPEMMALADSSPDTSEHRRDEPYRRALTGMYARLAATLKEFGGGEAARHALAPQNPYPRAAQFLADLRTIEASLQLHHGAALVQQRLHPLIRAVEVFGFHLAAVDLRQSSDQHEAVLADLLADGTHRVRLRQAVRAGAPRIAAETAGRRAAAAGHRRELFGAHAQRTGGVRNRQADARPVRPRSDPPLHHQPHGKRQ